MERWSDSEKDFLGKCSALISSELFEIMKSSSDKYESAFPALCDIQEKASEINRLVEAGSWEEIHRPIAALGAVALKFLYSLPAIMSGEGIKKPGE